MRIYLGHADGGFSSSDHAPRLEHTSFYHREMRQQQCMHSRAEALVQKAVTCKLLDTPNQGHATSGQCDWFPLAANLVIDE